MKVRQLKEKLNKLPEGQLDLEVRVIADHGQVAIPCASSGVEYIDGDSYMADVKHHDDVNEDSEEVYLISD